MLLTVISAIFSLALLLREKSRMKPISKHATRALLSIVVGLSLVGISSTTMAIPDFSHEKHPDELNASVVYKKALDGISGGCSDEAQAGRENPQRNASQHINDSCFGHKYTGNDLVLASGSNSVLWYTQDDLVRASGSNSVLWTGLEHGLFLLQPSEFVVQASVVTPAQDEPVPQPGTLALLGLGLAGLGWSRRRK